MKVTSSICIAEGAGKEDGDVGVGVGVCVEGWGVDGWGGGPWVGGWGGFGSL